MGLFRPSGACIFGAHLRSLPGIWGQTSVLYVRSTGTGCQGSYEGAPACANRLLPCPRASLYIPLGRVQQGYCYYRGSQSAHEHQALPMPCRPVQRWTHGGFWVQAPPRTWDAPAPVPAQPGPPSPGPAGSPLHEASQRQQQQRSQGKNNSGSASEPLVIMGSGMVSGSESSGRGVVLAEVRPQRTP